MKDIRGRVIVSGVSDPAFVMALDETFHSLAVSDRDRSPVLHFYRKTPSISLGYFQAIRKAVDVEACRDLGVGIFRRKSGGGTIFEDQDQLIYGLTLPRPADIGIPSGALDSFRFLNLPLIATLKEFGFPAEYVPVNDVLIRGKKISGCAQSRSGGVLLQHGTLIFRYDPFVMFRVLNVPAEKTAGKGLQESADRVTSLLQEASIGEVDPAFIALLRGPSMELVFTVVQDRFIPHASEIFGIRFERDTLSSEELGMAEDLAAQKYLKKEWTYRR